jgi:hypothetical protein
MRNPLIVALAPTANCFEPELGLQLAEAFTPDSHVPADGLTYAAHSIAHARYMDNLNKVHVFETTWDRMVSEPFNFTARLAKLKNGMESKVSSFDRLITDASQSCFDLSDMAHAYPRSLDAPTDVALAGILSSILAMRSQVCRYSTSDLTAFIQAELKVAADLLLETSPNPVVEQYNSCMRYRILDATSRLTQSFDAYYRGFLTMDRCLMASPQRISNTPWFYTPLGFKETTPEYWFEGEHSKVKAGGIVEVFQNGSDSESPLLIRRHANISYISVWFKRGSPAGIYRTALFGIEGLFCLNYENNVDGPRLLLFVGDAGNVTRFEVGPSMGFSPASNSWSFVSMAIRDKIVTVTLDGVQWKSTLNESFPQASFEGYQVHLGKERLPHSPYWTGIRYRQSSRGARRHNAPMSFTSYHIDPVLALTQSTVSFYDLKVSDDPDTTNDDNYVRAQLQRLGSAEPSDCLTEDGFEVRYGLFECYPASIAHVDLFHSGHHSDLTADVDLGESLALPTFSSAQLIYSAVAVVAISLVTVFGFACYILSLFKRYKKQLLEKLASPQSPQVNASADEQV